MNRISLSASERTILGKKVKNLRKQGSLPAHVFGQSKLSDSITVEKKEFMKVYADAGESGLINLKIGDEKVKPVLIREVSFHAVTNEPLHIDFYQVNLTEKVKVNVPIVLEGEESEIVHTGEAVILQPMNDIVVEALPDDLPEDFKVDVTSLREIDDAILVSQLILPEGVTIEADPEAVVVKLDNAITEEMKKLMEEQAAETAAAQAEAVTEDGEAPAGETPTEGSEQPAEGQGSEESKGEHQPAEESTKKNPQS